MRCSLKKLRKIWVNGTTGQKDGKINRETLTSVDQWIYGCGKEAEAIIKTCEEHPKYGNIQVAYLNGRADAFREMLGEKE